MSYIKKVDHITYACEAGTIERWAWFHIEVEGGTLINRIDDVRPGDPDSSMKIWCIDYGDFGVALIEGIDRAKKSQVTKFVDRHGDHSCQHVAFDTYDLEKFQSHMRDLGGSARGGTLVRNDGFGILKQMFAKGYAVGHAGETSFPESVERPKQWNDALFLAWTADEHEHNVLRFPLGSIQKRGSRGEGYTDFWSSDPV